ncbi:MAG: response regulator, partial [Gemmatimonadales bacterium]
TITIPRSSSDGTTFRIALPAYDPATGEHPGIATTLVSPSPLAGLRMLLVTTDATMRSSVQAFARLRGFRVTAASDGAAALACVRSEAFDFAVCDLDAPGLLDADFLTSIRCEQPSLAKRLLALNGTEEEALALQATALSAPFELDGMEEAAAGMLNSGRRISGASAVQS